ncbi:ribonuclease H-like domain-containing protein [Haematococcus lacustris]
MALPAPPGYIDVLKLAQLAQLKVQPAAQSPSLAQLVKEVLGRPLDKSMQCSDWAARPLTQAQLQYAATDAACLLALHDALLNLD